MQLDNGHLQLIYINLTYLVGDLLGKGAQSKKVP